MDLDRAAAVLLVIMPFTLGFKTLAIIITTAVLLGQDAKHDLGRYAVRFFIFLSITSLGLTGIFGRLAWVFHDADRLGPWFWWMLLIEVGGWGAAWYGIRMVRAERRLP